MDGETKKRSSDEALGEAETEKQKRKRLKKERKALMRRLQLGEGSREEYVNVYGAEACASVEMKKAFVPPKQLNELLLWMLVPESTSPKWVFVANKPLVERVVMVVCPGVSDALARRATETLAAVTARYGPHTRVQCPTNVRRGNYSALDELLKVPLKRLSRDVLKVIAPERLRMEEAGQKAAAPVAGPVGVTALLMSNEEMLRHHYPMPAEYMEHAKGEARPQAWGRFPSDTSAYAQTAPRADGSVDAASPPVYGLDCEMVETSAGYELARVTLVDAECKTVLDELVKPPHPVVHYHTRFSGITEELLAGVSTTLEEARAKMLTLVCADTVLVGHSLENDLHSLRLIHTRIADTSVLFPHHMGAPYKHKLKNLAAKYLQTNIQSGEHDSVEDAVACMGLLDLKKQHGLAFGMDKHEPVCNVIGLVSGLAKRVSVLMPSGMAGMYGNASHAADMVPCTSDHDAISGAVKALDRANLTWVHLNGAFTAWKEAEAGADDDAGAGEVGTRIVRELGGHLCRLHEQAPPHTMFVVTTLHGNTGKLRRMWAQKRAAETDGTFDGAKVKWDATKQQAYDALMGETRSGCLWVSVKLPPPTKKE